MARKAFSWFEFDYQLVNLGFWKQKHWEIDQLILFLERKKNERARERVVRESRSVIFCTCGEHVWDLKDQTRPRVDPAKKSGSELHELTESTHKNLNISYKKLINNTREYTL
jgi:hypothetical protein